MDNAMAEQFFMMLTLLVFGGLIFAYFAAKVTPKKSVKAAAVETGTGKFSLDLIFDSSIDKNYNWSNKTTFIKTTSISILSLGDATDVSWIPKEHQKKSSATQSPTARRRKAD